MKNHQQRQQHREEITEFRRNFINGDNKHLHDVIDNYQHLFSQIDIQHLNLTQEMFDRSFKDICKILFNTRSTGSSYIIALLGFALTLNEYYLSYYCYWYHVDMLINSLADVLEDINFQPNELIDDTSTNCMIL